MWTGHAISCPLRGSGSGQAVQPSHDPSLNIKPEAETAVALGTSQRCRYQRIKVVTLLAWKTALLHSLRNEG